MKFDETWHIGRSYYLVVIVDFTPACKRRSPARHNFDQKFHQPKFFHNLPAAVTKIDRMRLNRWKILGIDHTFYP